MVLLIVAALTFGDVAIAGAPASAVSSVPAAAAVVNEVVVSGGAAVQTEVAPRKGGRKKD